MHYVYHPHHEPVIVSPEEYSNYLENGWYDSPAKFPSVGMAESDPLPESQPVEVMPKKKGRPPKAKVEEVQEQAQA